MSFLDIKDPAERATLAKEYVTAMKTVKQRNMANRELKVVGLDDDHLCVEGEKYNLTPGIDALITHRQPEREDYTDDDFTTYRALVEQTNAKTTPNHAGVRYPYETWKWRHMLGKMFTPIESLPDEEGETEDIEGTNTSSMEDSPSPASSHKSWPPSPDISPPPSPPSPVRTRSGNARKTKDREPFYKGYNSEGVLYLPGDINGLAMKLQ